MTEAATHKLRIGIDLGGTKIEGLLMAPSGEEVQRHRIPAPRDDYQATIAAIAEVIGCLGTGDRARREIGIGMPGSISPATGRVQNANSTWLNGTPLHHDLEARLGRPVRLANDANCFALSEATDGSAAGARSAFGVILGTGCGGGLVFEGRLIDGPRGIGGEWGHNPLPWSEPHEHPGPRCWCGRLGCMEMWVSGTGLAADHRAITGEALDGTEIVRRALSGDLKATATLARHASRLARGLAHVVNLFDPEVIVLGGGLSKLDHLYEMVPDLAAPYIFADYATLNIVRPRWGDASGARGAARLWD